MTLHEVMKKGLDGRGLIRESPDATRVYARTTGAMFGGPGHPVATFAATV